VVYLPSCRTGEFDGASLAEGAALVESLVFYSVLVSDHVVMPAQVNSAYPYAGDHRWTYEPAHDWYDPLVSLTWAAAATKRVKLGTSVIVLPLRNPILLAKQIASLSRVASRRILLGVGVGWMKEEFDALDIPFHSRGRRAEEMVEVMRRLWSGDSVSYDGKYFSLDQLTAHPTPLPSPLILWGGHSARSLSHVARMGDGWYPLGLSVDDFEAAYAELDALCLKNGRRRESLSVCIGLGQSRNLTADVISWYSERNVSHLVCRLPSDPTEFRGEAVRISRIRNN
jgi:probable F420-dependent oxidoreductase